MMDEMARNTIVDDLRLAFADGRSAAGEELLAQALTDGMPWDVVTRAVAEGVAHCHNARLSAEEHSGTVALA